MSGPEARAPVYTNHPCPLVLVKSNCTTRSLKSPSPRPGRSSKKKRRIGSSFDDFLKDAGVYEEGTAKAIKRVIACQLGAVMRENHLTKSMLARRMRTSRAQLDRLLDPDNDSVTLGTLARAAHAVGRNLRMELV